MTGLWSAPGNVRVLRAPRALKRRVTLDEDQAAAILAAAIACEEFQRTLDRVAQALNREPKQTDLGQVARELRTVAQQFEYALDENDVRS